MDKKLKKPNSAVVTELFYFPLRKQRCWEFSLGPAPHTFMHNQILRLEEQGILTDGNYSQQKSVKLTLFCSVQFHLLLSCLVPSGPILSCQLLSSSVQSCAIPTYLVLSCPVLSISVLSYLVWSCPIWSGPVWSYPVQFSLLLSCPVLWSCPVQLRPVLAYPIQSGPILSYSIWSCPDWFSLVRSCPIQFCLALYSPSCLVLLLSTFVSSKAFTGSL